MHRYTVPADGVDYVIGLCGEIRHAALGQLVDEVDFWAEHEGGSVVPRAFRVFGTGQPIPDGYAYQGTTERQRGIVWHLYEHVSY